MSEIPEVFKVFEQKLARVLSFTLREKGQKKAIEELLVYFSGIVERASKAEARIAELEAEVTKGHELQDSYCDRIAELEAAQRWIPVSERLPEIGVRVLFYNNFIKNIHKGWYSGDEWVSEIGVFYNGDKLKRITHWMPLPKFPEVQE